MKAINILALALLPLIFLFSCQTDKEISNEKYKEIKNNFEVPAADNTLWCYYYWINDDIAKEGVTKDLEAMKKAGIGAVFIGNINPYESDGKVPLFSNEWWEVLKHTFVEAKRIGIEVGMFNCPGWSQSGGPWNTADKSMRYIAYSETLLEGGSTKEIQLEKPDSLFQDLYVMAIPTKKYRSGNSMIATVSTIPKTQNTENWFDGNTSSMAYINVSADSCIIEIKMKEKIKASSLLLTTKHGFTFNCNLYAFVSNEKKLIRSFLYERNNMSKQVGPLPFSPLVIAVPPTESDHFVLAFSNIDAKELWGQNQNRIGFSEIELTEKPVLEKYIEKQLGRMCPTPLPTWYTYQWEQQLSPESVEVEPGKMIMLTNKMDTNGLLKWDVPAGKWTVLRFGMVPTGVTNTPTASQGRGYEVDKMNATLAQYHFNSFIAKILDSIPEGSKDAFKYVIADSYETGSQNWTDGFREKFQQRYGYDPLKYFPVFSGRIVGSVMESDRFLWDLRRAIADDVAYEYVGGLKKAANEKNLKLWLENYGHWGFPSEFLLYGSQSDMVGGEFWTGTGLGSIECKAASSSAHIYGKTRTSAESFTSGAPIFTLHPAMLKKLSNWSYTEGINHRVLHVYIHQPDDKRIPGVNTWFGTEFNRHNTWFELSKYWMDYERRCQHMLQQGKYVADVCYFIGEHAPQMTGIRIPELPVGYSYDYINADAILNRMSVKNGKLLLPDGMQYSLMVLPPLKTMTPELIQKIEQLIAEGAVIVGPKPSESPSLKGYPKCDAKVKVMADKIWGEQYEKGILQRVYGKGKIFNELTLEAVFSSIGLTKDVDLNTSDTVIWTHRSLPGMEIYFVANQMSKTIDIAPSFRVNGLKAQLWNASTGEVFSIDDTPTQDGRTIVKLRMLPSQSWFVVFTNRKSDTFNKANLFANKKTLLSLDKAWTVQFLDTKQIALSTIQMEKLCDWTASENPMIRY